MENTMENKKKTMENHDVLDGNIRYFDAMDMIVLVHQRLSRTDFYRWVVELGVAC